MPPRSPSEYAVLADIIPNLTRQATSTIQTGFTGAAARQLAGAPSERAGLLQLMQSQPFPGAVDIQAPEIQQAAQVARATGEETAARQQAEQKQTAARQQAEQKQRVLQGGLDTAIEWYEQLKASPELEGITFVSPENIKGRQDLEKFYDINSKLIEMNQDEILANLRAQLRRPGRELEDILALRLSRYRTNATALESTLRKKFAREKEWKSFQQKLRGRFAERVIGRPLTTDEKTLQTIYRLVDETTKEIANLRKIPFGQPTPATPTASPTTTPTTTPTPRKRRSLKAIFE